MARDARISSRTVAAGSYDLRILPLLEKHCHWGKVQSWFRQAANVALPSGGLVTLVRKDTLNGPGFVCLDSSPGLIFGELRMRVGDAAHFISPAGTSRGGPPARLVVDLRTAQPWSPPPFARPPSPRSALKKVISTFSRNYSPPYPFSRDRGHRPLGRMDGELKLRMDALVSCLTNRKESEFENTFLSLLGLGDGLTPAADDFLTGALAAAWWLKEARSSEFLREEAAKLIARHADKTTPISRHFLSAAAQGVFCEFVYRLLDAFSGGDEKGIAAWADWIRGWGATSGAWFLHGFAATASALI